MRWVKGILLILAMAFLSACSILPEEEETLAPPLVEPVKIEYDLYEVKKDTITTELRGNGTFVSTKDYSLSFKNTSGRLKSINVKLGQEVKKGVVVAELDTGDLENRIKQQELSVKKAKLLLDQNQIELERLKSSGADQYQVDKAKNDVAMAQIDVDMANLQLQGLRIERERAKLLAPVNGTVVYIAKVNAGDPISAYQTLVQIADPSSLQLSYETNDASKFQVGMKATVKIDSKDYQGIVVAMPASVDPELREEMQNKIYLEVKNRPADVKMGDMADFTIITAKKENVIVVPRNAVKNYMGNDYVEILEGGSKKERYIEKGLQTPTMVEVVDGLKEGDKVILR
ncbi:efflux RND transporter periplasmic adaptor subunit [Mahella australiensis]|uniref:Efflux transporter, RND family, MFP subunit n=1 Tax=Mahella australiensis (strain DSM 15567 / CIP 107919 / 50-1 BON) TaxID=697281 RepID=F3ZYC1_MAHA5|nr:efflux RND transporter periplasmic adaptor subunit [Mahella australiensis]AEE95646.1 efflux transporter, RND family, MFP subunit [Mahella australiensis 50-1 BON]